MPKLSSFFSRPNEPDPSTELVQLNFALHSQNRTLLSQVNTLANRIQDLEQQISSDLKKIGDLQKELKSDWNDTYELIPKVEVVCGVLDGLIYSAVDIAENKIKDELLATKVKTLEADLSGIITQRNILAISLAVLAGSFVFFKLKK